MLTPSPSRSDTTELKYSPTRALTVIRASPFGVPTSVQRSATTRLKSQIETSRRLAGPLCGQRHANSRLIEVKYDEHGDAVAWSAEHDGYKVLDPPALHRRSVRLLEERRLEIIDVVETEGQYSVRIAFHFGPAVTAQMPTGLVGELKWLNDDGEEAEAKLDLAAGLTWSLWRGSTDPVLGWYSAGFGEKQPSTSVVGEGLLRGRAEFRTELQFRS